MGCGCSGQSGPKVQQKQGAPRSVRVETVKVLDGRYTPPRIVERQVIVNR